ncbi:MAG: hypothetical protein LUQ11_11600 [Methylococcaceae bacterium]|nr:hypothetical protein [Methylococcaceae bacterium]
MSRIATNHRRPFFSADESPSDITNPNPDLFGLRLLPVVNYYQATHSQDAAVDNDEDSHQLMEQMAQHQFSLPMDELIDKELAAFLVKAVASLLEKQAAILTMRFGLKDQGEMALQAVADQLHVTRERVRQIQNDRGTCKTR